MSAARNEGVREEVQHFRWPWERTYQGQYVNVTRTYQDRVTGQPVQVVHRNYEMSVVEYDQMQADELWKKILGAVMAIAVTAGVIAGGAHLAPYITKP